MRTQFFDMQWEANPENGRGFDGAEELSKFLDTLLSHEPFFFELRGANGYMLNIGISRERNAVQFSPDSGEPPYLMAVAPGNLAHLPTGAQKPYSAAARADSDAGVITCGTDGKGGASTCLVQALSYAACLYGGVSTTIDAGP